MEIYDEIHGLVRITDLMTSIVKTPQFQRLKNIQQLGCVGRIFEDIRITRYSHCIGTSILTGEYLMCLEKNTPNLKIPEFLKNCVIIAGLLHDVGHGPFSHLWENVSSVHHEDNSKGCLQNIFKKIEFTDPQQKYDPVELIYALIKGDRKLFPTSLGNFEFIFEIVHNSKCEIDVDKWDYLKRDAHRIAKYLPNNIVLPLNFDDVFKDARASNDGTHIEYKYEHTDKIYHIFKTREILHIHFYQEPRVILLQNILIKAVKLAEKKGYTFRGKLMSEITSNDNDIFLDLIDETIYDFLIRIDDPDIKKLMYYFSNPKLIQEMPEVNGKMESEWLIRIKIELAGQKMPSHEKFTFYGNPRNEPLVNKKIGFYNKTHYFRYLPEGNNN